MGGRDQIDIVAPNLLQVEHHLRQVFILDFPSSSFMGDGPVLAEDAAQVAVGEEDGTRAMLSDQ